MTPKVPHWISKILVQDANRSRNLPCVSSRSNTKVAALFMTSLSLSCLASSTHNLMFPSRSPAPPPFPGTNVIFHPANTDYIRRVADPAYNAPTSEARGGLYRKYLFAPLSLSHSLGTHIISNWLRYSLGRLERLATNVHSSIFMRELGLGCTQIVQGWCFIIIISSIIISIIIIIISSQDQFPPPLVLPPLPDISQIRMPCRQPSRSRYR